MADFDNETITMKKGQGLKKVLRKALDKKGQGERMDSDSGLFFINDVTVESIKGDEVQVKVEYEYGG